MSHLPEAIRNIVDAVQNLGDAVQNLARAARLDDKTSLGNSTALGEDATQIGSDLKKPDVVVFGDLNRFKQINDQFGHPAGDAALSYAGELISTLFVRGCEARAYRPSGDEFIITLKKDKLEMFIEKARLAFQSCTLTFNGEMLRFSMSFGYACTDADGATDFPTLLDRAEQACLVAKSHGVGTCVEWTGDLASQAIVTLRSRCPECNATIACDVPAAQAPEQRRLRICPVCEARLDQEIPLLQAAGSAPAAQSE